MAPTYQFKRNAMRQQSRGRLKFSSFTFTPTSRVVMAVNSIQRI